jgi:hypothetical protein
LAQVLYYMAIAEKKRRRQNTCDINYSSKQLMIWHHNDNDGRSWFYRPAIRKGSRH